jgi:uncharacterized membrane protein YesL
MKAQAAPGFCCACGHYNTKLPQVGELVLTRIISQFRKSFKRNNKVGGFFCDVFLALYLTFFPVIRLSVIQRPPSSPILSTNLSCMKSLHFKFSSSSLNGRQIVPELLRTSFVGEGLFARSIMKAQDASLPFTPVFSALVAIINTKLPQVGELVLTRVISQFKKSFKWNNKVGFYLFMIGLFQTNYLHFFVIRSFVIPQLLSSPISSINLLHMKLLRSKFLSSALNGQMTPSKSPSVSLRVGAFLSENSPKANATVLLERSDNSIEIAVGFTHEVGAFLSEISPKTNATVFERFRAVLNEGKSVNEYKI